MAEDKKKLKETLDGPVSKALAPGSVKNVFAQARYDHTANAKVLIEGSLVLEAELRREAATTLQRFYHDRVRVANCLHKGHQSKLTHAQLVAPRSRSRSLTRTILTGATTAMRTFTANACARA